MNTLTAGKEQQAILERINKARSTEPEKPTDESAGEGEPVEITDTEGTELPEEVEVAEVQAKATDAEPEEIAETPIADKTAQLGSEEAEEFYIDLDGEELSFSQIRDLKQGSLRQSDYTQKTQKLADEKRDFETEKESLIAKSKELDDHIAELKLVIGERDENDFGGYESMDELRDNDPGLYLKKQEQQQNRKAALEKAQSDQSYVSDEDTQARQTAQLNRLAQDNNWIKDGKESAVYQKDIDRVTKYLVSLGYTEETMRGILTTGHGQAYLDAARFHEGKKSNAAVLKKVRKAPVVTKPGGAARSETVTELEKARADHKRLGTTESALALRKAQRKFKGS